jgi:hypothetical protein
MMIKKNKTVDFMIQPIPVHIKLINRKLHECRLLT